MPHLTVLLRRGGCAGLVLVCLAGCGSGPQPRRDPPVYLTETGFYKLPYDMQKKTFINQWEGSRAGVIGAKPVVYTTYPGIDVWEVLIYEVYSSDVAKPSRGQGPQPDHREYVLFRNGQLKAWGGGPLTLSAYDVLVERKVVSDK